MQQEPQQPTETERRRTEDFQGQLRQATRRLNAHTEEIKASEDEARKAQSRARLAMFFSVATLVLAVLVPIVLTIFESSPPDFPSRLDVNVVSVPTASTVTDESGGGSVSPRDGMSSGRADDIPSGFRVVATSVEVLRSFRIRDRDPISVQWITVSGICTELLGPTSEVDLECRYTLILRDEQSGSLTSLRVGEGCFEAAPIGTVWREYMAIDGPCGPVASSLAE